MVSKRAAISNDRCCQKLEFGVCTRSEERKRERERERRERDEICVINGKYKEISWRVREGRRRRRRRREK